MKYLRLLGRTVYNWRELWMWPAIALFQLYLLIKLATLLTGHPPKEGAESLVSLGFGVLVCTLAISLLSILRESTSKWWTPEQLIDRPHLIWTQAIVKIAFGAIFVYALTHG